MKLFSQIVEKVYLFCFSEKSLIHMTTVVVCMPGHWLAVCDVHLTRSVCFRLLSEILKETNEDIEEIEYLTDGSWRPVKEEKERERERSATPECPLVDICKFFCVFFFLPEGLLWPVSF